MNPREEVKIESCDSHDGIIVIFLDGDKNVGEFVPKENKTSIIGGFDGAKE